jgi:hypothetical protein
VAGKIRHRVPDKILYKKQDICEEKLVFDSIPEKYSTIASGATTIGSTGRAPDDIIEQASM